MKIVKRGAVSEVVVYSLDTETDLNVMWSAAFRYRLNVVVVGFRCSVLSTAMTSFRSGPGLAKPPGSLPKFMVLVSLVFCHQS